MARKACVLTLKQREGLAYLIEDHIDSNSYDWQLAQDDHNDAITYWSDMLREIGFKKRATQLDKEYKI